MTPTQRIFIPAVHLGSGPRGVGGLLNVLAPAWSFPAPLSLDFTACTFISAEGVAILAILKLGRDVRRQTTQIAWDTVVPQIYKQLGRWELTALFEKPNHPWTDNALPLFHQASLDRRSLIAYIDKCTVCGVNMPKMSDGLLKEIRKSFCEVFTNIFQHADSPIGGVAVGQFYPLIKQVQLCVCDGGVGIASRVQGAGFATGSPAAAIRWALESGNSTRREPNHPGGLGLYLLREFVRKNGGRLRIYGNNGCYCEDAGTCSEQRMTAAFPGTLFELRLKVRDDVAYKLRHE